MPVAPLPIWIQWAAVIGVLIAGIGLILQSVTFFVDRWNRRSDIRRNRFDDYWFRQVLLPVCVEPLIILAHDSIRELSKLHRLDPEGGAVDDNIQTWLDLFTVRKIGIVNSSLLLTIYDDELYRSFSDGLDKLEDGVADHVGRLGMSLAGDAAFILQDELYIQQFIWAAIRDLLEKVISHHHNV